MPVPEEDPLLQTSRREAAISIGVFVLALAYTIGYCTAFGYDIPTEELELVWGVPSWVMWGIFVPWGLCTLFHLWFSVAVMKDHVLEEPALPPDAEGMTEYEWPSA